MGLLRGIFEIAMSYDEVTPVGKIVQGNWVDYRIIPIKDDKNAFGILAYSSDYNIYYDEKNHQYLTGKLYNFTRVIDKLSSQTISHYAEVGSSTSGPNAGAFIAGTLTGGPLLGAAAAMGSASSTTDIAVYMKDGDKFIIHFYSQSSAQKFKQIAFKL